MPVDVTDVSWLRTNPTIWISIADIIKQLADIIIIIIILLSLFYIFIHKWFAEHVTTVYEEHKSKINIDTVYHWMQPAY